MPNSKKLTDNFKDCLSDWTKFNSQGLAVLSKSSRQDPVDPIQLDKTTASLRQVLESMYAEYARICNADIDCDREHIRALIAMHDQEFMVKESIQSIVAEKDFFTGQHLSGCLALWKTEVYVESDSIGNNNA